MIKNAKFFRLLSRARMHRSGSSVSKNDVMYLLTNDVRLPGHYLGNAAMSHADRSRYMTNLVTFFVKLEDLLSICHSKRTSRVVRPA